ASKEETDASIDRNNNTGVNVPNTAANTHLNGAIQHYTLKDLYVDGAETGNVAGPNDAHSRTISLKIYAKRMPDGSTVNEIGIFDITDVDNIYGRRFPVAGPDQSFVLDDRSPGHKKYELKFEVLPDGNRKIIFSRPGGGAQLETSVSELYNKRADQAAGLKNIISVGGEEFYVLPQGGARGAVAMFPKALIDGRGVPGQDPRNLVPKLYAEIGKRAADGRNQNLPGKPRLGKVGKTDYHLEFNEELGVWEVEEGEGDPLPTTPTTGDATGPAGANPGGDNTGAAPGPVPDGGYTFVDFVNKFLAGDIASGKCKINSDDMKDLAGDLREKFGVVACQDERVGVQRIVIVPKTATSPNQQMDYSIPGFKLQGVRFYDHFLILQFDKQVQYLDLRKQDKDGNGKETGFAMSGFISDKKEASKFTDARALVDAFNHYMGTVPAAALTEVPRRVQAAVGGKPYYLTAGFPLGALTVNVQSGGETFNVWPEVSRGGAAADPTPNPYTNLGGPANAMDGAVSSVPEAFKPEFDSAGWKAKLIGTLPNAEMKGIALYELSDPIGKDKNKKYQLSFRYKAMDPDGAKVFQMKPFEVFNSASPHPGAGLELQGLTAGPVVDDRVASGYKFVQGSKKERGVLAVFQNKQVSAANAKKGAANCVGPVLWWGLKDRDAAVKVCEEDKF
ncbi:MAG: hypothetical protein NUW21_15395, partial [Elusimicrobia bacterium]|nr:hypothetical protein [Elusimicrobiota bacterium]